MAPTELERLDWAEQHLLAARDLFESKKHYGWAATALFYSGMQAVIAGFQRLPGLTIAQRNPENHTGRHVGAEGTNLIVRDHVPHLRLSYDSLSTASWDARYRGAPSTREQVRELRRRDLAAVTEWACGLVHTDDGCNCWLTKVRDGWPT